MTRVLAELLGASQPGFSLMLRRLEAAAGRPSADIKLVSEISQAYKKKLQELGLDPADTTSEELYHALDERFKHDETVVRTSLGLEGDYGVDAVMTAVQRFGKNAVSKQKLLSIKVTVAKTLLKKVPPKKTMKLLNYRSLDSMLKHESMAHLFAGAYVTESRAWRKKFIEQYSLLKSTDFESRVMDVTLPNSIRWKKLAHGITGTRKHNVLAVPELASVVILPVEKDMHGLVTANVLLILHACNDLRAINSFLRLHQVKLNFGTVLKEIADHEPQLNSHLEEQQVPWKVVHKYYAQQKNAFNPLIFEPHVHPSDFAWHSPQALLSALHPDLQFWKNTAGVAKSEAQKCVSLNLLDIAINHCNMLSFTARTTEYVKQHLWHELMTRYVNPENIEHTITQEMELQPAFVELDA
jgi:hypothetical protein